MSNRPRSVRCDDPDIFMISFIYTITEQEGLLLDYRFRNIALTPLYSTDIVDAVLISDIERNILLIECKSDLKNADVKETVQNVKKKFDEMDRILEGNLSELHRTYEREKVLLVFEDKCNVFREVVSKINEHDIVLWSIRLVRMAGGQGYSLTKCSGSRTHRNSRLETELISRPIVVEEELITCKPLLSHKLTPKEIAFHLAFPFFNYAYDNSGKMIHLGKVALELRRKTSSPLPVDKFMAAIKDLVVLFPDVAVLKRGGQYVEFKKRLLYLADVGVAERLNLIKKLSNNAYRNLITSLRGKPIEEFKKIIKEKIQEYLDVDSF